MTAKSRKVANKGVTEVELESIVREIPIMVDSISYDSEPKNIENYI